MPIDIHGLARRYESLPGLDLGSIRESVYSFRSILQGRKKELLKPFGLDNLDKYKDDPNAFKDSVDAAMESFKQKKEESALYRKLYEDCRCLVTFTARPEGAAAAGSHLKVDGEVKCPWCICVKHPENKKWWDEYHSAALAFIFTKDDACCIVLTAMDALSTIEGSFAFSQVEGIENEGLKGKPEEQRKVLDRLYRKTGLSDSRLGEILRPALEPMRGLEKSVLNESLVAAVRDSDAERVKECLDLGADVETLDGSGGRALHWAARGKRPDVCKMLIDAGAEVNALDGFGCTPLYPAANRGHLEICKLLLNAGAVVDARTNAEYTPLHPAAIGGHLEICKLLIDVGADVNFRDIKGRTSLHWAAIGGHLEVCKLLMDAGADVDAPDENGCTPLYFVARRGYLEIVKLLMDAGADVKTRSQTGSTTLHEAALMGRIETCKLILDAGVEVDARDRDGNTPLKLAALGGHHETCKLLIKAGADVNARDKKGRTPLSIARSGGHRKVEELLLKAGAQE